MKELIFLAILIIGAVAAQIQRSKITEEKICD